MCIVANEIVIYSPRSLEEHTTLAKTLAPSVAVPAELRGKPADVMAIIMRGAELGLPPMSALASMHCIKGRVTLSADGMAALVRRNREVCVYLRLVESNSEVATFETQRVGDQAPTRLSFTRAQAKAAGLGGDNWQRFPDAMLRARCLSAICRAVHSDLLLGLYDPDELGGEAAPSAVTPPPAPAAHVVDAVSVTPAAPASPPVAPAKERRLTIVDEEAKVPAEAAPKGEWDADLAAIASCKNQGELDALAKSHGKKWPQSVRAEWGIASERMRKGGA